MTQDNTSDNSTAGESTSSDLFNTAAGWVLFAGVVGLGLSVLSDKYFHAYDPEDLPKDKMGYIVEGVEEEEGAAAGPSLATLLVSATPEDGAKVFQKCQTCHAIEQGDNQAKAGPNLWGVMGKGIAKNAPGFSYSSALSGVGGQWTWENMDAWLANPRGFASGTSMSFAGLSKPEDRANLMAFLESKGGAPARPVEEAPAETEAEETTEELEAEADADVEAVAEAEQNVAEAQTEDAVEASAE